MDVLSVPRPRPSARGAMALRRWAVASLVANVVIVVTGGVVRLTSSGLGCPTWPRCDETSYVTHPALGYHGVIEFGNRLLTFVLILVALLTFVAALRYREDGRRRADLVLLAGLLALGIPAQGVIGGITVLTGLNPFLVALHLLVSMVLISLAVVLIRRTRGHYAEPAGPVGLWAARLAFAGMWLSVWVGTVLTGSGPHAGDLQAERTGFDPVAVAHVHGAAVGITVAATVVAVLALRRRAAYGLLAVEGVQATLGVVQYSTGLPIGLVALHLLGAAAAIALATNLLLSVRRAVREPVPAAGLEAADSATADRATVR